MELHFTFTATLYLTALSAQPHWNPLTAGVEQVPLVPRADGLVVDLTSLVLVLLLVEVQVGLTVDHDETGRTDVRARAGH